MERVTHSKYDTNLCLVVLSIFGLLGDEPERVSHGHTPAPRPRVVVDDDDDQQQLLLTLNREVEECMKVITAARLLVAVPKPLAGFRPNAVGDSPSPEGWPNAL